MRGFPHAAAWSEGAAEIAPRGLGDPALLIPRIEALA
jgi:hypothetical protein